MHTEARIFLVLLFFLLLSQHSVAQHHSVRNFYKSLKGGTVRFIRPADSLVDDYAELRQIVLIRHGQPDISRQGWMNRQEFSNYIFTYDTVGVVPFEVQPFERSNGLPYVYTSRLNRAMHSARLLFGRDMVYVADKRFNEFQRKAMAFPNIKMPFGFWSGLGRALWLLGIHDANIESFSDARFRAYYNAILLEDEAEQHGKTLLVAHGFMNRYIAKYLKKRGWEVLDLNGRSYFGCYVAYKIR